jgi:hypothetical protein
MIHTTLTDCKWGVEKTDDGVLINIGDPDSQLFHIPFEGESLEKLVIALSEGLTEDQKKMVMASMSIRVRHEDVL